MISTYLLDFIAFFPIFQCLLSFVVYVAADIGLTAPQNQYLPPNKGYNYDRPNVPFGNAPSLPSQPVEYI